MIRNEEAYTGPRDSWEIIWEVVRERIEELKREDDHEAASDIQKAVNSIVETEVR